MNSSLRCPRKFRDRGRFNGSLDAKDDTQEVVWRVSGCFQGDLREGEMSLKRHLCTKALRKTENHTSSAQGTRAVLYCGRIETERQGRLDGR